MTSTRQNDVLRETALKSLSQYELNFALDAQTSIKLIDSATQRMAANAPSQRICDLYYASSDAETKSNTKSARQGYRVRRINCAWDVLLESLSWERDTCSVRRTVVPSNDLVKLQSDVIDKSWSGKWFHKKLVKNKLGPWLEARFDSATWKCDTIDGEIQLTVDHDIQVAGARSDSSVGLAANIVRMNFSVSLPSVFKALIYEFALLPDQPTLLLELAKTAAKPPRSEGLLDVRRAVSGAESLGGCRDENSGAAESLGDFRYINEVATCQLG